MVVLFDPSRHQVDDDVARAAGIEAVLHLAGIAAAEVAGPHGRGKKADASIQAECYNTVESKESFFHYVCQLSEIVIEVLDLFQQA